MPQPRSSTLAGSDAGVEQQLPGDRSEELVEQMEAWGSRAAGVEDVVLLGGDRGDDRVIDCHDCLRAGRGSIAWIGLDGS